MASLRRYRNLALEELSDYGPSNYRHEAGLFELLQQSGMLVVDPTQRYVTV